MAEQVSVKLDPQASRQELVVAVFDAFDKADLEVVVLRNHAGIADQTEKDIDALVEFSRAQEVLAIIQGCCQRLPGWIVCYDYAFANNFMVTCAPSPNRILDASEPTPRAVRFHFCTYVSISTSEWSLKLKGWKQRVYAGEVPYRCLKIGSLVMNAPADSWQALLLANQLVKKDKIEYRDALTALSRSLPAGLGERVSMICRTSKLDRLALVEFNRNLIECLRSGRGFKLSRRLARMAAMVRLTGKYLTRRNGIIVQFSGPDGAGKSTARENTVAYLQGNLGLKVVGLRGLTPLNNVFGAQLTRLQEILRGVPKVSADEKQRHHRDRRPKSQVKLTLWKCRRLLGLLFLVAQYYPGFLAARIRNHLGQSVVVDTAIHDRFVKAHRPRFPFLEKAVIPLLPKSDVIFQMVADPDAIVARKPELSAVEITEYYHTMNQIFRGNPSVEHVSSDRGVDVANKSIASRLTIMLRSRA